MWFRHGGLSRSGDFNEWLVSIGQLTGLYAGLAVLVGLVLVSRSPWLERRYGDGSAWRVGVRLPSSPDSVGAIVSLNRGAVASSGTYERGNHIWGPGVDVGAVIGVSVVGPSLGHADALATALYADQSQNLGWMNGYPDYGRARIRRRGGSAVVGQHRRSRGDTWEISTQSRTKRVLRFPRRGCL